MTSSSVRNILVLALLAFAIVNSGCDKGRIDSISMVNQGIEAFNNKKFSLAKGYFQKAVELHDANDKAHYHLGLVAETEKDKKAAAAHFKKAHELNSENIGAAYHLAHLWIEGGEGLGKAGDMLKQILKQDPRHYKASFELGRALEKQGDYAEADKAYRGAITIYSLYARPFHRLAKLYMRFGHLQEAIAVLEEGNRLNPGSLPICTTLGIALKEAGRFDEAKEAFNNAVGLGPDDGINLYYLAGVIEEQSRVLDGKKREALEDEAMKLLDQFVERSDPADELERQMAVAMKHRILGDRDTKWRANPELAPQGH